MLRSQPPSTEWQEGRRNVRPASWQATTGHGNDEVFSHEGSEKMMVSMNCHRHHCSSVDVVSDHIAFEQATGGPSGVTRPAPAKTDLTLPRATLHLFLTNTRCCCKRLLAILSQDKPRLALLTPVHAVSARPARLSDSRPDSEARAPDPHHLGSDCVCHRSQYLSLSLLSQRLRHDQIAGCGGGASRRVLARSDLMVCRLSQSKSWMDAVMNARCSAS